jgi:hypothetical protein
MPSLFPNSNLSTASQPWGREVEKRLVNLDLTVNSNEINNTARDIQLSNSLSRVNSAVAATQAIINNIYVAGTQEINGAVLQAATLSGSKIITGTIPGTKLTANTITANEIATNYVYAGTITAGQITAGTLTGFTIRTAATGQRAELAGSNITFYNSTSGSPVGSIAGNTYGAYNVIDISGMATVSGQLWALGGLNVSSGAVISGNSQITGTLNIYSGGLSSVGSISTDGGLTRTDYAGGGTTGASINNNGTIIRTTSSARYKQDISSLEFNYEDVLALEPKKFRLKDEVADNTDARYYAGFIAEELADTSLDIFVGYQSHDGTARPDSVYYSELTTALLSAIKHQDGIIKNLTNRIEALENK